MEASIPQVVGELLRLNVEVFVDVAERTLDLIYERDAAADQPDAHAGLQQHEAGTDARDERVAGIGQYERVGNERIAELHRDVRVPSSATNFVLSESATPAPPHGTIAMT